MCNVLLRNRAELTDLIYSLGVFTKNELLARFSEGRDGEIAIDGQQTISEYLEDLVQLGALRFENGEYSVTREMAY